VRTTLVVVEDITARTHKNSQPQPQTRVINFYKKKNEPFFRSGHPSLGFFSLYQIPTYISTTYASHKYASTHIVLLEQQHTYRNASTSLHNHVICVRIYTPGPVWLMRPWHFTSVFYLQLHSSFAADQQHNVLLLYEDNIYINIYTLIIYYRDSILRSATTTTTICHDTS